MKLIKRIKFAFTYDFSPEFIVYSIPDQSAMRFIDYDDAKSFSESQIQYRSHIMVSVKKVHHK